MKKLEKLVRPIYGGSSLNLRHEMNLKVKHLFFSMPTKIRTILRITAILTLYNGKLKKK